MYLAVFDGKGLRLLCLGYLNWLKYNGRFSWPLRGFTMETKKSLFPILWDAACTEKQLADVVQLLEQLRASAPETEEDWLIPLSHKLQAAHHCAASVKHQLLALFHSLP